ncbi:hypothetical protein [Streptomyces sp. TRM64462]|uniref:hypothetical protein n=1 Tax=Streptomyces sp. TRM64462 TaxID=2741726 RepID=UPI0015864908|nr:hypothetical protein [Streptomyces sp. TRM64462]
MGTEGRRTVQGRPQTSREVVCPACGEPVGTAIKRRKVLGAWVPEWRPQPCHNPQCVLFGRTPHESKDWKYAKRRLKALREKALRERNDQESRNEPGNSTKIG